MSSSKPLANKQFFWLSGAIILGFTVVSVPAGDSLAAFARSRAVQHADIAGQTGNEAQQISELQLANALDPSNPSYRNQLADRYVQAGQLQQAASVLGGTVGERVRKAGLLMQIGEYTQGLSALKGLNGPDAAVARSQIYLEEGSGSSAILAVQGQSGDDSLVQLAYSYAVGGQSQRIALLVGQASSNTAKQQLVVAQTGGLRLAEALYAAKLYHSAQTLLQASTSASAASYELLAHSCLSQLPSTHNRLLAARGAAAQAASLDPSNPALHELLQSVDTQLDDTADAATQAGLIKQLQVGTP
jgi:hypothetical protein